MKTLSPLQCPQTPFWRVVCHIRCMTAGKHFKWHLMGVWREIKPFA